MFLAGDKVVHPGYGPGVIRCIERRQIVGEEKQYYIIDMMTGGGTLMTPVTRANEIGLRSAISRAKAAALLKMLSEEPSPLPGDFKERQAGVQECLNEGDIFKSAGVIRDLAWHGHKRGLTKRDQQLKEKAEELVAGELALVKGIPLKEALEQMEAALVAAIGSG